MSAISGECKHRERDIWGVRRYNADRTKRQRREEHDVLGMAAGGHRTALLTALSGTQTSLCQRMRSVPVYRGLTYWEVQQIAKAAPTSITPCGEDTIRRWVSGRYQIALRFNRYDVCLGVEEEIDG